MTQVFQRLVKEVILKKFMKIILILLGIVLVLAVAVFCYIKTMLPGGGGNNDIAEGYYKNFKSDAPLEMKYSQLGSYEIS